jgi:hypothetical protein
MIKNRAPIASMFSFQSYTIAIMIVRNSVNRDRCMTFDILTVDAVKNGTRGTITPVKYQVSKEVEPDTFEYLSHCHAHLLGILGVPFTHTCWESWSEGKARM